jgi:hemoglobin
VRIIDTPYANRAAEARLDPELVRRVVDKFYEKLRKDPALGPVFEGAVGNDWDAHMDRIHSFWLTATRIGGRYEGRNFMPAHLKQDSITATLLPRWLLVFAETASEICPPEGAVVLVDIAERMADSIRVSLGRRDRPEPAG